MTITTCFVSRLPAMGIKLTATSFGKDVECRASKRSCTADETLLTFCPPGPEARTNDSESSDSSMEMVSVIRIIPTSRHQIFFRKHLAFFHRRLIKRIDSQKMRGDDCLEHEMHHQLAEGRLIEPVDVNRAHRTAVLHQCLRSRAPFGRDQITDALAGEAGLARKLCKIAIHRWTAPCAIGCDHGEELVARATDEELQ